jgi:hypothetical protein
VKTVTAPSTRDATSTRFSALFIATPLAWGPACTVCNSLGFAGSLRSISDTRSSGSGFIGSAGLTFCAAVTMANFSLLLTTMALGDPIIEAGTFTLPITRGGYLPRSITLTLSGVTPVASAF